jgi:hypothetical protein
MDVKIVSSGNGTPAGKLAAGELHFDEGPLAGLKLVGFGVWERRNAAGRGVTLPARQFAVQGERRTFVLMRPIGEGDSADALREHILRFYADEKEPCDPRRQDPGPDTRDLGPSRLPPTHSGAAGTPAGLGATRG